MGGVAAGAMGLGIIISLRDYASKGIDQLKEKVQGLKGVTTEMSRSFSQGAVDVVRGGAMMAGGAMLLATAFNAPIEAAMRFETTMAEVNKVANFSAEEYGAMAAGLREMARNIPVTVDELGNIVAAAAQSGVAKNDLLDFAEQAAYMGVAFDIAGGQAGQMMADWRAGMGLTLPQVYSLADAVNYLSNNMNATAPALGEVIQRVGAAAMSCGLAEKEVAALGAAFLSAGASPEIAATALKSFTTTLVRGAAMSKSQAEAFRSLGFSVEQLAADMQVDARQAIFSVLQALSQVPAEMRMSLLSEMFGQESLGAIAPLLQNMGNLSQAFELVGAEANYAGSMFAEYEARANTAENSIALLRNRIEDLKIAFGTVALGPFRVIVDAISGVVGLVAQLPKPVLAVLAGLTALVGTALVLMGTFSAIVGILGMWNVAVLAAKAQAIAAFANIRGIVTALGTALTKGPLLAVSKLAIAAGLLYLAWRTNFLGIRDAATAMTEGFKMAVKASKDGIVEVDEATYNALNEAGLWDIAVTMGRVFWRARQFVEGFAEGWRDAWKAVGVAWEGFKAAMAPVMNIFRPLLNMLRAIGILGETNASAWEDYGRVIGMIASLLVPFLGAMKGISMMRGALSLVTAAVGGFARIIGAIPFKAIAFGVNLVISAVGRLGVALLTKVIPAVLSFTVALLTNPITWVVASVAALCAGLYLLWKNWDAVKAKVLEWWKAVKGIFSGAVEWVSSVFSGIFAAITNPFKSAFDTVKGWWENLKALIFGGGPTLEVAGAGGAPVPIGAPPLPSPVVTDRSGVPAAAVLAARNETQARQNAAAAAQNPPANVNSSVSVSVEPQTTVVNLDGREIGRSVTRYNAHERKRRGKEE